MISSSVAILPAKVQQKMHICNKIARKFAFKCYFDAKVRFLKIPSLFVS